MTVGAGDQLGTFDLLDSLGLGPADASLATAADPNRGGKGQVLLASQGVGNDHADVIEHRVRGAVCGTALDGPCMVCRALIGVRYGFAVSKSGLQVAAGNHVVGDRAGGKDLRAGGTATSTSL